AVDLSVHYRHGRPALALPLPFRQEKCLFLLRPMVSNVSDFIQIIKREDSEVSTVSVLTKDGVEMTSNTSMCTVLSKDFQLCINGVIYNVQAAPTVPTEALRSLADIKDIVHKLNTALNLPKHHLMQEIKLRQKLNILKQELIPLEQMKANLDIRAEQSCSHALWLGLAILSVKTGVWLTWSVAWEFLEPLAYFITYFFSMTVYTYYILTKQAFVYSAVNDRQFLHYFYKSAKKQKFNVEKYNILKDELASVEEDLRRLRYPNKLQMPMEQIK
ncbi:calcium uniporter protein, mitochondrial, partial [Silurus asotus]